MQGREILSFPLSGLAFFLVKESKDVNQISRKMPSLPV